MRDALELLTTTDVARQFQVTRHTVARWVRDGHLSAVRTPGNRMRFEPAEVQRFRESPKAVA